MFLLKNIEYFNSISGKHSERRFVSGHLPRHWPLRVLHLVWRHQQGVLQLLLPLQLVWEGMLCPNVCPLYVLCMSSVCPLLLRFPVTVLAAAPGPRSARPPWVRSWPPPAPARCRRPSPASWPLTTSPCPAASCRPWPPRTAAWAARSRRTWPLYRYPRTRPTILSSIFPTLVPELSQESSQLGSKHLCSRKLIAERKPIIEIDCWCHRTKWWPKRFDRSWS